ncbi:MAG: hypothetical protein ACOYMZ_03825 [Minisyncoccia bacterium]
MLPQQAIEEYKELYRKRFGVVLSDAEAVLRANRLVNLYKAVLGPESHQVGIVEKSNNKR